MPLRPALMHSPKLANFELDGPDLAVRAFTGMQAGDNGPFLTNSICVTLTAHCAPATS